MYFRSGDNIPREAIKSKHSRSGRTDDIDGRIRGTEHCSGETAQGGDREGHRKADRKLLRADTRSQYHRGNRDVCARVRAGATHRNPRCAPDLCRNFVTSLSRTAAQFGHGEEYRYLLCVAKENKESTT